MTTFLFACVVLAVGVTAQQQQNTVYDAKPSTRTLVADVLRDFQGMCFGSTTGQFYEQGATWNLQVFCGQATCMKNTTGFFEVVEDCGPSPNVNDQCQPILSPAGTAFPGCCPKYECLPGAKLTFPTEAEIKARVEKARQEQANAKLNPQQAGPPVKPVAQA